MHGQTYRGNRLYVCSGYSEKTTDCPRLAVRESELIETTLREVETFFRANMDTVNAAIAADVKRRHAESKVSGNRIETSLAKAEGQLEKAEQRLLIVDADMVSIVQKEIRRLQDVVLMLQTEQEAVSRDPIDESKVLFERFCEASNRLRWAREHLADAEPSKLRATFAEFQLNIVPTIDRVPLGGKRHRCDLVGGEIPIKWPGMTAGVAGVLFSELACLPCQ